MELALLLAAFLCFRAGFPFAALILRCGLTACLRFSPRAATALCSVCTLCGYFSALLCRNPFRSVPPAQRIPLLLAAITGGTAGRMLLLMFVARFSGSLALARVQAVPLLMFAVLPLALRRAFPPPKTKTSLCLLALPCAVIEGFFGCSGAALFALCDRSRIRRKPDALSSGTLLLSALSQASALALTLLSGAAEVFPFRMLIFLGAGAALGALCFEKTKQRGEVHRGLRIALRVYMLLAALSGIEQAYENPD